MPDDYSSNPFTSGHVNIGGSTSGIVESSFDEDWFSVSLTGGLSYAFRLTSAGLADPFLALYSSTGTFLAYDDDSGGNLNSLLTFVPLTSGTYFLGASAYYDGTGSYTLQAVATDDFAGSQSTSGHVNIGGTSTGRIEASYDHDWFSVSLTAGQTYAISLAAAAQSGLVDPYLRLYAANGALISSDDDSGGNLNSLLYFTAGTTGTYYVDAGAYSNGIGNYVVQVASLGPADDFASTTQTTGHVDINGSATGRIETDYDHDWFRITLTAGNNYVLHLDSAGAGGLYDPYLRLYDANGNFLLSNDDGGGNLNSLLSITVTGSGTGTYYIDAAAYGYGTGNYVVSVDHTGASDDYAQNASTTGHATVGGVATGRINFEGDHDWFSVSLVAGRSYQFHLDASGVDGLYDPYLRLYSANGTLLTANDDGGGNLNSLLNFTPSTSGTYYLDAAAYSWGTGNYALTIPSIPTDDYLANTATTGHVNIGSSSTGRIETAGDHDWFSVQVSAGRYEFHLNSGSGDALADPYLRLYNSSGTLLASNDDSGGTLNSLVSYTFSTGGTYYLDAAAYSTGTGNYTASATFLGPTDDFAANTGTSGHVNIGASATGRIETTGDHDWFSVSLTAGQAYQFTLNSASVSGLVDPFLRLYNSSGTQLAFNDDGGGNLNSLLAYTSTVTGTYYLDAGAYSSGTGSYALSAAATGAAPTSDPFNITVDYSGNAAYQAVFASAAARWSQVITQGLPSVYDAGLGLTIDDLYISASVGAIDGVGGILGQANWIGVRSGSNLPYRGFMQFDEADMANMAANGTLQGVILHEMGHVLGLSATLWNSDHLLDPSNSTHYTGTSALQQYRGLAGNQNFSYVPLETTGGAGTRGQHWSEATFDTELMTGYANGQLPLSVVTIGGLADLGYHVNFGAADPYHL